MLSTAGLSLILLMLILAPVTDAGVGGKISGVVVDVQTDEAIIGASLQIVGTSIGTVTDEDGEYFLIDVPSGKYELSVSSIGFETIIKQNVRVLMDLTTPVDFEMSVQPVELDRRVIVQAENPIIQKDLTASRVTFTSDQLRTLPNVITVQSVLRNYPGVVIDRDNTLHVRGGRAGQLTYLYDGFSIQDPFTAEAGIHVVPSALEELSLTTGGFNAEYGEAMSGVVSAVTRQGTSVYHGGLKAYEGFTHQYNVASGDWGSLESPGNRALLFDFSGPIPGLDSRRYTFFSAGEYLRQFGSLPHDWAITYTGTAKLSMQPTSRLKIKTNLSYSTSDGQMYTHRDQNNISYDRNLDGLPSEESNAMLAGFSGNYYINDATIFTAKVSRFHNRRLVSPTHLMGKHWSEWPGYSEDAQGNYNGTIDDSNYWATPDYSDAWEATGFTAGSDFHPIYLLRKTTYDSYGAALIHQANKIHELKAGAEYRTYSIEWDSKKFYNDFPYGETYKSSPTYAAVYLQDKMEYRSFIVNAGLRFTYRNADISFNSTPKDEPTWTKSKSNTRVSPRLGVSFPISEKSVMHFNYGIYYQVPRYSYMYTNLQGDIGSGLPLLGNPNLEPEQTAAYELGLDHLIGRSLRLDVTAYYKDIKELVTTRSSFTTGVANSGQPVTQFTNDDYGSVQGLDFSLEKLADGGNFTASIAYSYLMAKGIGSDAMEPYYTNITAITDTLAAVSEYSLDFDQRHTVTALLNYNAPADWKGQLAGVAIPGAWSFNMIGRFGSGLPYTPTDPFGNRLGERNTGRLPANYVIDMRFNKDFKIGGGKYGMSYFIEVDNLFDRRNVINVYSETGSPDDDGNIVGTSQLSLDEQEVAEADFLYDHDPQNYSSPRTVRTGLSFNF